jgi:hypothetical protein
MFKAFQLFEQGNFSKDGHRHPVLGQGKPHGLQGYNVASEPVFSLIHRSIGTYIIGTKFKSLINTHNDICPGRPPSRDSH